MKRPVADYVALSFIGKIENPDDIFSSTYSRDFRGSWLELKSEAEKRCGFEISDALLRQTVRTLSDIGLIRISEDRYAGEFVKINSQKFSEFIEKAQNEYDEVLKEDNLDVLLKGSSDFPNASALSRHSVIEDYSELGDEWLKRALAGLKEQIEEAGSIAEMFDPDGDQQAPASDRVITFNHNEASEFESKTSEIIDLVESMNSIGEKRGYRELVLGQLKAGRELIKSTCFRVYFLQITLIDTLIMLAKRYERETIGALASTLAVALAKRLGIEV